MIEKTDSTAKQARIIPRRVFLPWLITSIGAIGSSVLLFQSFRRTETKTRTLIGDKPRFKKRKPDNQLKLARGFYLNPRSQIIHYIPEGERLRFTGCTNTRHLQPTTAADVLKYATGTKPRVNVSRLSNSLEQAAAEQILQNNIELSCELLFYAIQRERPISYRLYDLLAGLSVRFGKPDQMKRLIAHVNQMQSPQALENFNPRLKKWHDPQSLWYRRWTDQSKKLRWTTNNGPVLLM